MPLDESQRKQAQSADLRPGQETRVAGHMTPPVFGSAILPDGQPHWAQHQREELRSAVAVQRWDHAMRLSLQIGAEAEMRNDVGLMLEAAWSLVRLELYGRAFELLEKALRGADRRAWNGDNLSELSVFVDPRKGDVAKFLFWAPLVGDVAKRAKRCTVLVDPRIVPLYRRTFPSIDLATAENERPARQAADTLTTFEGLARHLWKTAPSQTQMLLPDARLVAELGRRYRNGKPGPLIGIAWGSLNQNKAKPDLSAWRHLLEKIPGTFVSLQYGDIQPALRDLGEAVAARIICDDSVDQMEDLDRFAAQITSLDVVVSISNTGAHIAGAVGVPTIVILGDDFYLLWPAFGVHTRWYSNTLMVRRNRRTWRETMEEVDMRLRDVLAYTRGRQ